MVDATIIPQKDKLNVIVSVGLFTKKLTWQRDYTNNNK